MNNEEEKKGFKITDRRVKIDDVLPEEPAPQPEKKSPPPPPSAAPPPKQAQPQQPNGKKEQSPRPGSITFEQLLMSFGHSALMHLGEIANPADGKKYVDLESAQQTIDLLLMLQEKTRGNLSPKEEVLLTNLLGDLQMRFVERKSKPV